MTRPWARFDDLRAGTALRCPPPHRVLVARRPEEVADVLQEVDEATGRGAWAYGCVSYEAAAGLDPTFPGSRVQGRLPLLARLATLVELGFPVLVGASRKRFLGTVLASADRQRDPAERKAATVAATVLAARAGAWAVRVHDVADNADAVRLVAALRQVRQVEAPRG